MEGWHDKVGAIFLVDRGIARTQIQSLLETFLGLFPIMSQR